MIDHKFAGQSGDVPGKSLVLLETGKAAEIDQMNVEAFWKWIGPGGHLFVEARSQRCSHQVAVRRIVSRICWRIRKLRAWNLLREIQVGHNARTGSEIVGDEHRQAAAL